MKKINCRIRLITINLMLSNPNLIPLKTPMFKRNAHPKKRKIRKKKPIGQSLQITHNTKTQMIIYWIVRH